MLCTKLAPNNQIYSICIHHCIQSPQKHLIWLLNDPNSTLIFQSSSWSISTAIIFQHKLLHIFQTSQLLHMALSDWSLKQIHNAPMWKLITWFQGNTFCVWCSRLTLKPKPPSFPSIQLPTTQQLSLVAQFFQGMVPTRLIPSFLVHVCRDSSTSLKHTFNASSSKLPLNFKISSICELRLRKHILTETSPSTNATHLQQCLNHTLEAHQLIATAATHYRDHSQTSPTTTGHSYSPPVIACCARFLPALHQHATSYSPPCPNDHALVMPSIRICLLPPLQAYCLPCFSANARLQPVGCEHPSTTRHAT